MDENQIEEAFFMALKLNYHPILKQIYLRI